MSKYKSIRFQLEDITYATTKDQHIVLESDWKYILKLTNFDMKYCKTNKDTYNINIKINNGYNVCIYDVIESDKYGYKNALKGIVISAIQRELLDALKNNKDVIAADITINREVLLKERKAVYYIKIEKFLRTIESKVNEFELISDNLEVKLNGELSTNINLLTERAKPMHNGITLK